HEGRGFMPTSRDAETTAAYDRLNEQWAAGETSVRVEGGESPDEVWARVRPVLVELGEAYPDADVLVVSHRRLLRILLAGALPGGGLSRMHDYPHGNAALSVLDVPGGRLGPEVRLVHMADTAHLAGL
ncbi:MAG TPA: histidine phosphatase family protein, partial [Rubricoccaceae bacterium]